QYAHGNEPSHHMAYLYNFVNKPFKTQEKTRQILTELYMNSPDGISGNEDCGQMSAWYIFSSLGFYPVTPGSNQYIIGSPLFDKATINLENGKSFTVEAIDNSSENKYIKSATLNGENYEFSFINHKDIINGGSLVFEMTDKQTNWGTADKNIPKTSIDEHLIVAAPFIAKGKIAFKGSTEITLGNADKEATIFYTLGDEFQLYKEPFKISEKGILKVYAEKEGLKSKTITTDFYKINPDIKINLKSEYANQYSAGGDDALIDGIVGAEDFRTGTWQGYFDTDLVAVVDLGKVDNKEGKITVNFLEDQRSWIFLPTEVDCLVSSDGKSFRSLGKYNDLNTKEKEDVSVQNYVFKYPPRFKVRYIKVIAKKLGILPKWHLGYKHEGRSWLFVDEIQIK
ncbi:MAG: glycoside hydrolase family 92 protein, partial [Polaribacter sp.]